MISALHFTFNHIFSGIYGLLIAEIDGGGGIQTSTPFTYSFDSFKTAAGRRYMIAGKRIDEMPTKEFQIYSADGSSLPGVLQEEIIGWIDDDSDDDFKQLEIHQPSLDNLFFNCVFTQISKQYHGNEVVGLILTAALDSEHAYKATKRKTIKSDGTDWVTVKLINDSNSSKYNYPIVQFNVKESIAGKDVSIYNDSDSISRCFEFSGLRDSGLLRADEELVVNNSAKMISKRRIGETIESQIYALGNFGDKNWLRLKKSVNNLRIRINGEVTISYTPFVKIGL